MARNLRTEKIIDEILRYGVTSAALGAAFVAPNILIGLKKPIEKLYEHLDDRERKREVMRVIYYMKNRGYLAGDYEFGLQLTDRAKELLRKRDIEKLETTPQSVWDKRWRIICYDIPVSHSGARRALQEKLHKYGCFHLQSSVLITPFPCLEDIKAIAATYDVSDYISYFEATGLMNEAVLIRRFQKRFPHTKF